MEKHKLTLAIYPNSHGIGYVLSEGPKNIIDFGLKKVQPILNSHFIKKTQDLLAFGKPDVIFLLNVQDGKTHVSKRTQELVKDIEKMAHSQGLTIRCYSRLDIQSAFEVFGADSKYDIAMTILRWYPQLKSKVPHKRLAWMSEHYQMGVFDAFALMLTHYHNSS